MPLDRLRVLELFKALANRLSKPTSLCLIGSTPALISGQEERQTQDIDVWHTSSNYDAGELADACKSEGILFDPHDEIDPDAVYLQIVRPGIVALPQDFEREVVARFGPLTLTMPNPAVLAAAKLTRGSDRDIEDVVWWLRHRALGLDEVEAAIATLPRPADRETARDNLVVVRLVCGRA